MFKRIVAVLRIAVPYTGMIMPTRESAKTRRECLEIGITQISGGVGPASAVMWKKSGMRIRSSSMWKTEDPGSGSRLPDRPWDMCRASARPATEEGRTGDRFMSLLKSGQIANCCQPNAPMTPKEFLMDYAGEESRKKGDEIIAERLAMIPNEKVREALYGASQEDRRRRERLPILIRTGECHEFK